MWRRDVRLKRLRQLLVVTLMGHIAKIRAPLGQGNPAKRGIAPIIALIPRCGTINRSGFHRLLESPPWPPPPAGRSAVGEKGEGGCKSSMKPGLPGQVRFFTPSRLPRDYVQNDTTRCASINDSRFRRLLESPSLEGREKGRVNVGDRPVAPTPNPCSA